MNRITAVLLAMIALLVHALVVHRGSTGAFAHSYDSAHVAYVLGRNLAETGQTFWWRPGTDELQAVGGLWSYPSPLMVWIAAALEILSTNVDRAAQLIGTLCVLATVFLSTRFDTDRIAGVIPALLLVTSGAVAAAGASGTEWPIAMFALTTAFVALEHGRSYYASAALLMLVLVRPEGIFAAAALLVMTAMRRTRPAPAGDTSRAPSLFAFVPAVLGLGAAHALGASLLDDAARALMFDASTVSHGRGQLLDFTISTATPLLLLFPLVAIVRGGLSNVGFRALVMTLVWTVAAMTIGGGPSPFDMAFTPVLPISFIAIQQGMARALDTYRRSMERLVWIALSVGMLGALLASRFPGNLGPFALLDLQTSVHTASAEPPLGRSHLMARSALFSELRLVRNLRRIGSFLNGRVAPDTTILSPWPGVLGWRTDAHVIDAFGRIAGVTENDRVSWAPEPGPFDLEAALSMEPDYILPAIGGLDDYVSGALTELVPERLFVLDGRDDAELRAAVRPMLARYEILVTTGRDLPSRFPSRPLLLLQRRGLWSDATIRGRETDGVVTVTAGFDRAGSAEDSAKLGLPQVCDLQIHGVFDDGSRVLLDPLGQPSKNGERSAVGIVIDPRWRTRVTLAEVPVTSLESGARRLVRVDVRLLHHRVSASDPRADAASPLILPMR